MDESLDSVVVVHDSAGRAIVGRLANEADYTNDVMKLSSPMMLQVSVQGTQLQTSLFPLFSALGLDEIEVKWSIKARASRSMTSDYLKAAVAERANRVGISLASTLPPNTRGVR